MPSAEPRLDVGMDSVPVLALMGPTASGKTALAVELASRLPLDIVSVDSAMVYRYLDIGTGKPGLEVLARAPHRLIDIRDPVESYSAAEFRADAMLAIRSIRRAGRAPLLVGGTSLYFRALIRGLSTLPPADPGIRRRIESEAHRDGWGAMHARLAAVDPDAARRIHPNDPQRIERALEVYEITGQRLSVLQAQGREGALAGRFHAFSLEPGDRVRLHRSIESRFDEMMERGLVAEVASLREHWPLTVEHSSMRAVGYRQVWAHLEGECDEAGMRARAVAATRQLARRQLTWLRGEPGAERVDPGQAGMLDLVLRKAETLIGNRAPPAGSRRPEPGT